MDSQNAEDATVESDEVAEAIAQQTNAPEVAAHIDAPTSPAITMVSVQAELDHARRRIADQEESLTVALSERMELTRRLRQSEAQVGTIIGRYRAAVLKAEPALPEELVSGTTLDEIDRSVTAARSVVAKVRREAERELQGRTPLPPDVLARMTPEQKIRHGLTERRWW